MGSGYLETKAYPSLGELSDTIRQTVEMIKEMNMANSSLCENFKQTVYPLLESVVNEDLTTEGSLKREMENACYNYEYLLCNALQNRAALPEAELNNITETRSEYELMRFDLVTRLNLLDCNKKIKLTEAACNIYKSYKDALDMAQSSFADCEDNFSTKSAEAQKSKETLSIQEGLWSMVRTR